MHAHTNAALNFQNSTSEKENDTFSVILILTESCIIVNQVLHILD